MPDSKQKSAHAFRTISEASEELNVPQHVLRFWETKFSQIRPLKRGGRRRYYRSEDISLLTSIRDLLYNKGYTIKGVQRLLKEGTAKRSLSAEQAEKLDHAATADFRKIPASKPPGQTPERYSPFSQDDIAEAQRSRDSILFSPSRIALQTAVKQLRDIQKELRSLSQS